MINRIAVVAISVFLMTFSTATFGVSINTADVSKFLCVPVSSWKAAGAAVGAGAVIPGVLVFSLKGRSDEYLGFAIFGALHSVVALGLLKAVPNNPYVKASVLVGLPLAEFLFIPANNEEKVFFGIFGSISSLATLGALNYMNA